MPRLWDAAKRGDAAAVAKFLREGDDANGRAANGWAPLIVAAEQGHVDAIKALLEAHADVDAANNNGDRAFDLAVKNGHTAAIHLIEGGAAIHLIEPLEPRVELAREADSSSSTLEERIRTLEADNRALRAMVLGWGEGRWAHPDVPQPDEEVEKFKVSGRQWG